MSEGRMPWLEGFVWDWTLAAWRGSEENVWCLLTGRWEATMGREGGVVSVVGGGGLVFAGDGGLAEEEEFCGKVKKE